MSDPKRATLITVGAPKSAKGNVNKTVRLTINLDESNESKYPELNYKELVIAEERKKHIHNGKTAGLDPFSDNDDDVELVARKFEQKYGGKSTYGRRKARKKDEFADIGAGYDENDSFIDNTHGYDEMMPPDCDTFHGGFYINSGSLVFKTVPHEQSANSDEPANRRNKRRISSSSSEDDSSESSSESESQDGDEKDTKAIVNGAVDSHKTEHRKKKNKKSDKTKAKKVRRTDSSAATSGKQTSDENGHGDAESADCLDSRTSQSDSLTSKPAPSSENAITSDSSRDAEAKVDNKLPQAVVQVLDALEASVAKQLMEHPSVSAKQLLANNEHHLLRLDEAVKQSAAEAGAARAAWARAAAACGTARAALAQRLRRARARPQPRAADAETSTTTTNIAQPTSVNTTTASTTVTTNSKRKHVDDDDFDVDKLTDEEREAKIVETLDRLKALIEERKPSMLANYNAECERVQEERKKLQVAGAAGGAEKRLPKRRFPWCAAARALLARLRALARAPPAAAALLAARALPLFPPGFVRMPTLLRQADLSKEIKMSDVKRQRINSTTQLAIANIPTNTQNTTPAIPFTEPLQFPSSLTVTATLKTSPEANEIMETDEKYKTNSIFGSIMNSFSLSKDLIAEKEKKDDKKEELYIPLNNIGSITITPVPSQKDKKPSVIISDKQLSSGGLIRVKSPAALNDMVNKKDIKTIKKIEKTHSSSKEKRVESPLHIDTNYQPSKKDPSPKNSETNYHTSKKDPSPKSKDEITQKQIENMRVAEDKIPRPTLVPVHHSPTFAKPDKRPPEGKKKKDLIVVSDLDPLSDLSEPLNIDDSSSDVEVIETTDKSDSIVPSKDKKSSVKSVPKVNDGKGIDEEETNSDFDTVMRNIREMEHSQETTKFNSNSYGGVITSVKRELASNKGRYARSAIYDARNDKDKFAERTSLKKMDGSNPITG